MILSDFAKALAQLPDPRFRRVLWRGLGLTLALLLVLCVLLVAAIRLLLPATLTLPLIGTLPLTGALVSGASLLILLAASTFVMVPAAAAFSSLFLDDVAQAVEDRHYPGLPAAVAVPFGQTLTDTVRFFALVLIVNLGALILYPFAGPFAPLLFWAINGVLLGREYFHLAASRRMTPAAAKSLYHRHAAQIWLAGTLMAAPLSVPLLNLIVPLLGAATFTHLFHRLTARRSGETDRYPPA